MATAKAKTKTYEVTIERNGSLCFIPVTFDPVAAFGKVRVPVKVRLELDTEERTVTPPPDFVKALRAKKGAWDAWSSLSFTHRREHVEAIEDAKKPETRARRIAKSVAMILGK